MALKTPQEFIDSIAALDLEIYLFGEKVDDYTNNPIIRPSLNSMAMTYELAQYPEYEDLMLATSHLTGKKVNRFTHIHQSTEDLVKKVKMQRLLGQKTGACFQRCVGMDAINALWSVTFDCDKAKGTGYHEKFREYVRYLQENDLVADGAMTDPKGDRSKSPSQQADPDCTCTSSSGARTASSCAAPRPTRRAPATRTRSSSCPLSPCAKATRTMRSPSAHRRTRPASSTSTGASLRTRASLRTTSSTSATGGSAATRH